MNFVSRIERSFQKESTPQFRIGDSVDVHYRIQEGDRERIQIFSGVIISRKGSGMRSSFIVRRIVQGEGVERMFPLHSPRVADIVVKRHGRVRRAKLYYLRNRTGKRSRLVERFEKTTERTQGAPETGGAPSSAEPKPATEPKTSKTKTAPVVSES